MHKLIIMVLSLAFSGIVIAQTKILSSKIVTTQPVTTQPVTTQPVTTQPVTMQPVTMQPMSLVSSSLVSFPVSSSKVEESGSINSSGWVHYRLSVIPVRGESYFIGEVNVGLASNVWLVPVPKDASMIPEITPAGESQLLQLQLQNPDVSLTVVSGWGQLLSDHTINNDVVISYPNGTTRAPIPWPGSLVCIEQLNKIAVAPERFIHNYEIFIAWDRAIIGIAMWPDEYFAVNLTISE